MKTQFNLQMTLTKEETIGLQAIFVKRADILNDVGLETGYSLEIVCYSKNSSYNKNNVIDYRIETVNEYKKLIYKWQYLKKKRLVYKPSS